MLLWTSGRTLKGNCQGLWPKQFIVSQCTSASYKSRRLDQFEVLGFFALFRLRRGFALVAGGGDVVPSCELTLHGEILSLETSPASRPSDILQPSGSVPSFSVKFSSSASSCSYKRERETRFRSISWLKADIRLSKIRAYLFLFVFLSREVDLFWTGRGRRRRRGKTELLELFNKGGNDWLRADGFLLLLV